jgi:hypothetical protein
MVGDRSGSAEIMERSCSGWSSGGTIRLKGYCKLVLDCRSSCLFSAIWYENRPVRHVYHAFSRPGIQELPIDAFVDAING